MQGISGRPMAGDLQVGLGPRPPVHRTRLPLLPRWALREAVRPGRVRLQPEVRTRLWPHVERGHELVRSQGHPKVPASLHRPEGWSGTLRVRFKPRARLPRGP